jgi:WG containing repeat
LNGQANIGDTSIALGRYKIPARFYDAGAFSEGLAAVQPFAAVEAYGFINKSGGLVIQVDYDEVRSFCDGLAAVWRNGKWGYINRKGETVIEPGSRKLPIFHMGLPTLSYRMRRDNFVMLESTGRAKCSGFQKTPCG